MNSLTPDEAVFAKAALPWFANGLPEAGFFLIETEANTGTIPAYCGADEALGGISGQLKSGGGKNGDQGEDEISEGHVEVIWGK